MEGALVPEILTGLGVLLCGFGIWRAVALWRGRRDAWIGWPRLLWEGAHLVPAGLLGAFLLVLGIKAGIERLGDFL